MDGSFGSSTVFGCKITIFFGIIQIIIRDSFFIYFSYDSYDS